MAKEKSSRRRNRLAAGAFLRSKSTIYSAESILGQGTFGTVAKCRRMDDKTTVAIKVQPNKGKLAKNEVDNLLKLSAFDSDNRNIVKWHKAFIDRDYFCLEFEHLDKSLSDFMKERNNKPLLLREIRPIIQQIANGLDHLKTVGIIHADLKPSNIMLVNHAQQPYRVKIIDFGSAFDVSLASPGDYMQARAYRAPEILLGIGYTEAVDMWSLGCVAAYLHLGTTLYPGCCEYQMIRYIEETQGQLPNNLLCQGRKTANFFNRAYSPPFSSWELKTKKQYIEETGILPIDYREVKLRSLKQLLSIPPVTSDKGVDKKAEKMDRKMFVRMLKGMLELEAASRLTPRKVMEHPFIRMSKIDSKAHSSAYVRSCIKTMAICEKNTGRVPSNKAHPSQQKFSAAPGPDDHDQSKPSLYRPCSSTWSTKKSVTKRKGHDNKDINESSRLPKKAKNKHSGWSGNDTMRIPIFQDSRAQQSHQNCLIHPGHDDDNGSKPSRRQPYSSGQSRRKSVAKRKDHDEYSNAPKKAKSERSSWCCKDKISIPIVQDSRAQQSHQNCLIHPGHDDDNGSKPSRRQPYSSGQSRRKSVAKRKDHDEYSNAPKKAKSERSSWCCKEKISIPIVQDNKAKPSQHNCGRKSVAKRRVNDEYSNLPKKTKYEHSESAGRPSTSSISAVTDTHADVPHQEVSVSAEISQTPTGNRTGRSTTRDSNQNSCFLQDELKSPCIELCWNW